MKKRALAAVLWFYAGWYAWSVIAMFLGISELGGPVFGAAAAALIAGDPRGLIWTRRVKPAAPATVPTTLPVGRPA